MIAFTIAVCLTLFLQEQKVTKNIYVQWVWTRSKHDVNISIIDLSIVREVDISYEILLTNFQTTECKDLLNALSTSNISLQNILK